MAQTQNQTIENEIVPLINVKRSIREQQSISETLRFNFYNYLLYYFLVKQQQLNQL